ncbi:Voldacs domain-containing protein [Aspergillus ruber CBS 135680]|uniref:Regulator of volume decrease after cellular swelling-domain-containing protein n=1 Tax=Aspergillus ruber (strain CBS 135680) TaxID=1388766 RepID=A0A017SNE2_ASPRC|nr:uncharacterized protein EURHEDRAFT_408804 [Aspergillus ruber CBS 135680]EYE98467.1 hypothetical protein EURHEDRAFT_408804 [Aspergillus ruber CBS 135680]
MEPLNTPPEASSFVLLADHQSRTPASFHTGPPVLHYHSKACKLVIFERDLLSVPALNAIRGASSSATNGNGDAEGEEGKEVVIDGVDVWVTSDKFLLYTPSASTGLTIPYPSISLHAIQRLKLPTSPSNEVQGLYMQIATPTPTGPTADDEEECITLTIVPPTAPETLGGTSTSETATPTATGHATEDQSATQVLYAAVSACSNLHPDPVLPGDEDEGEEWDGEGDEAVQQIGLPPAMPGSSGWITADNMHEYFDEEGNWIAGGQEPVLPLGPGAGTVRTRDEENETVGQEHEGENDEAKWQRTD